MASARTGMMTALTACQPRRAPPRSRRARRTRCTDSMSWGATDKAITTATDASYRAAGTLRSARLGLASALAAPRHNSIAASRLASYRVNTRPSALTGPPSRIPAAQAGSWTCGRVTSTVAPPVAPISTKKNSLTETIKAPRTA
jgi:hypothetical protein